MSARIFSNPWNFSNPASTKPFPHSDRPKFEPGHRTWHTFAVLKRGRRTVRCPAPRTRDIPADESGRHHLWKRLTGQFRNVVVLGAGASLLTSPVGELTQPAGFEGLR
jgi:hypothetical protein